MSDRPRVKTKHKGVYTRETKSGRRYVIYVDGRFVTLEPGVIESEAVLERQRLMKPARRRIAYPEPGPPRPGTIYVIGTPEIPGRIKIGWTQSTPEARMYGLQTGSPVELELVASFQGTISEERALHRKLSEHHVRGEWFQVDIGELAHHLPTGVLA